MDIYIDVLFIENAAINYITLFLCTKLLSIKSKSYRLLLVAFLGAFYSIICVIFPNIILLNFLTKILVSVIMVFLAFGKMRIPRFLMILCIFYLANFALAGCILALSYAYVSSSSILALASGCILIFVIFKGAFDYIKERKRTKELCGKLSIICDDTVIDTIAFIDTGNKLRDPVTKAPVIVVEQELLKKILPENIMGNPEDLPISFKKRIRLIPFTTVGESDGVMTGFRPDKIIFNGTEFTKVIVAIYNGRLSKKGEYGALLNLEIIEGENQ